MCPYQYNAGQRPGKVVHMNEHDVCEILKAALPGTTWLVKLLTISAAFSGASEFERELEHNPQRGAFLAAVGQKILNEMEERGVIKRD